MTITQRYQQLAEQRAYHRRITESALPALLAPYAQTPPVVGVAVPVQRRHVIVTVSS